MRAGVAVGLASLLSSLLLRYTKELLITVFFFPKNFLSICIYTMGVVTPSRSKQSKSGENRTPLLPRKEVTCTPLG
jgi:hypothetical protein